MNIYEQSSANAGLPTSRSRFGQLAMHYPGLGAGHGYPHMESPEPSGFDPLRLLWFAIHYRWLVSACILAGLVVCILFTFMQTPLYRSAAKLEMLTAGAKVIKDLEIVDTSTDQRRFETARLKMKSRDLARRVVYELNLTEDQVFLAPTPSFSLWNLVNRATGRTSQANINDMSAEERENLAVGKVQNGLSVSLVRNTAILEASFSHPSPKYAALVTNQVVQSFVDQTVDKTSETSDLARQFIEEQVQETKVKLQNSEEKLVAYAKQAGITVTGNDASLISENISQINAALAQAIRDRLSAERFFEQVRAGNSASLPEVFKSESIQSTKQKIAELKASYQQKLGTLKPGFPEMQRLGAQIRELQKQVDAEIQSIAKSVDIRFEQAKETEAALKRELSQLEERQSRYQDKNIKYTILKREVDSNRTQYESLIKKLNEVRIGADLRNSNVSMVDMAQTPSSPYKPVLSRNLLLSLLLSGAIAAALIYLLELMNDSFSVPDQIESELKIPVLGIIPLLENGDIFDAFNDSKSAISEAYRSLRTSIQFTGVESTMRTLLVTSSEPSEGKSTTVHKLARDFASLGKRVLVIDADLRKPRMHRLFNIPNTSGLSNLLSNVVRDGEVISIFQRTAIPNITLLTAGIIPPNPVDLLMSQRMGLTLHYCAKKYDLVIIDSPPVMGLSDAPILSRQTDATLLVISAKQATRKAVNAALSRLLSAGGNVVGAAFTRFAVNRFDYNYSYRYTQYNYYSYEGSTRQIEEDVSPLLKGPARARGRFAFLHDLCHRFIGRIT